MFRGLAALSVVLYHINLQFTAFVPGTPDVNAHPWIWMAHRLGFLGVDFFFVLSGFIIYHVHCRDLGVPGQSRAFLLKRFLRIQPLLWVIIVIKQCYLSFGVKGAKEGWQLFNTIFTLPGDKMIGVSWSLTFEWMFYLFFFACILLGRRWFWGGAAVWALLIAMLSFSHWEGWNIWLQVLLNPFVVEFLAGVLAAEALRRWSRLTPRKNLSCLAAIGVLILVGLVLSPFCLSPRQWQIPLDRSLGRYYWAVAFALLVWWAAINEASFRRRWLAPFLVIGNASYAIYLFHNEMLQAFIRIGNKANLFGHGSAVFWMWLFTLVILGICLVVHFTIEKPLLNWSRRMMGLARPAASGSTPNSP
ncbi:acyltransferase [soil metagenome]